MNKVPRVTVVNVGHRGRVIDQQRDWGWAGGICHGLPGRSGVGDAVYECWRSVMWTTTAWLILIVAGIVEITWAVGMKYWSLDTLLAEYLRRDSVLVDLYLLSIPIRQLPAGTTYSVWVGIGSIGVTLFGIIMFGENASPMRLACLGLILVGVIGLKLLPA